MFFCIFVEYFLVILISFETYRFQMLNFSVLMIIGIMFDGGYGLNSMDIETFGYDINWDDVSMQNKFKNAVMNDGIFYWNMPDGLNGLYGKAYENGIEFFRKSNIEWDNAGEYVPNELNRWNMTQWQRRDVMETKDINKFWYGYKDYRNSNPPGYMKHFVLPMIYKDIIYDTNAHPFNQSVVLFCNEMIYLSMFVLNKIFTILNLTNDLNVYNRILGQNPLKHCSLAYYHYPSMFDKESNITLGNGLNGHKDLGFISILKQDSNGFQIWRSNQTNACTDDSNITCITKKNTM